MKTVDEITKRKETESPAALKWESSVHFPTQDVLWVSLRVATRLRKPWLRAEDERYKFLDAFLEPN